MRQRKVSQDPGNYNDAPTEGIRRVLEIVTGESIPRGQVLDTKKIGTFSPLSGVSTRRSLDVQIISGSVRPSRRMRCWSARAINMLC